MLKLFRARSIALSRATITEDQIAPATRTSLVHDLREPNHSETLDLSNQIEPNTGHTNHVVDIDSLDEFMIQEITQSDIPPEELKSSMQKIFLESPFLAQSAIEEQPLHLEYMPFDIPGREELVRLAITKDGYALEHASPDEKKNRELVLLSLDNFSYDEDYGSPLAYADPILHSDPILVEKAMNAPDTTPPLFFNGLHDYTSETVYRALETLGSEALETAKRGLLDDPKIYQWVRENYRFRACSNILGAIMPNSFFNDRDWIIQTLKNNGQFLEELPAPINQDPEFLNIAKQSGLGSALYNFDHEFKRHLNNIIEFQVFDVLPESIIYPETITFEHISNAVHYCPTQLAVAITAHAIENKNIDTADLILFQISSDIPTHKMLAITTAIPAESVIMADTNTKNIAIQLYQDPYVFTHVPNAAHYINAMSNWLQPLGVKIFHANDLLSRERCAALFDHQNQNSVLFISSKDLDNFSSGLNGLLESGTWTVDDCTDSIKARIVVVGDKKLLKQDILSRLNRHSDVQALISAKTETPTEPTYSKRTENSTPLKTIFDAKELLDTRFVSVRECFESINECGILPNAPILISDESEVPLLEDALPSGLTTCYKPSKYPIGTNPTPVIAHQEAPCHSLILLDNGSDVDSMIDYFLGQVGTTSGIRTSDILKNTKVYLNGCTNTNLLTAVYRDKSGIQNLIYRGNHYPVQSVCYSRLNPNPEEIQLDSAIHQLLYDNDQDTLKHYYQQSPLDTSTDCANTIYSHLAQFIVNQKPVIIFEGPPGIGKDALTGHFLNQLQTLKYSGICCHHITAGYDFSLIDELLRLRTETPDKLIILAVSEGNLYDSAHWKEALLMISNDRNIKIVTTQNATSMGGRFDLKTLFKDAVVHLDYDLSRAADINQPSNAKHHLTHASAAIIKDLHHKLSAEFKESITNRQLAAILRVFTESKLESFIQYY